MQSSQIALACCFDSGYASRAVVMLESAIRDSTASIYALALDATVSSSVNIGYQVQWSHFESLVSGNAELQFAIHDRTRAEAIFTVNPSWLLEVIETLPKNSWLVYSDVDVWFHVGLREMLKAHHEANVLITRHRHYWWNRKRLAKFGEFNVGVIAFRNNDAGKKVLQNWAQACIEWCYDAPEEGKYADQKYLESFSDWGAGVVIDERVGSNFAPWNSSCTILQQSGSKIFAGGEPLLYSHMQGLKRMRNRWQLGHLPFFSLAGVSLKKILYLPYLAELENANLKLAPNLTPSSVRSSKNLRTRILQKIINLLALALCQTISIRKIRRHATNSPSE